MGFTFQATPGDSVTGFNPVTVGDNITKNVSYSVGVGANQVNQYLRQLIDLAPSGNTTIDLTSFLNALNLSASSFARIKAIRFRLLSATETNGTAANSVTIGNAGSNSHPLFLGGGTNTIVLANGGAVAWAVASAAGVAVNSSQRNIFIVNGDAGLNAKVEVVVLGGET